MAPQYRLWSSSRSTWCDYEIPAEYMEPAALRSLVAVDWTGEGTKIERDFELSPEPLSGGQISRVAVRADGLTVGFLAANDAAEWQGVIRRIIASGYVPVTNGNLWIYDSWEGVSARFSIKLGKPSEALPINDPPSAPCTLVPRSSIVQVTKEEEHAEALLKYVPQSGYGLAYVTLHEQPPTGASAKPRVEVRINDDRVGQLTPQMSQKYLPMIKHLADRGLVTACWGDITGNRVAAEVRIDCRRANEADDVVLDGPPITLPRLSDGIERLTARRRPGRVVSSDLAHSHDLDL